LRRGSAFVNGKITIRVNLAPGRLGFGKRGSLQKNDPRGSGFFTFQVMMSFLERLPPW
jgi:hypothetical protein